MPVGIPTFCGTRLTQARLARGLFKKSLGDMVGISGAQIGRYEDEQDKPQIEKLSLLAEKLNFPVEFFSRPIWSEDLAPIFWRSQSSESKYAREMTAQRASWMCEIFAFLEEEVNFPALNLPSLDVPRDFRLITSEFIENAAEAVRAHWSLGDRPIPDMVLALENAGIPVVQLEIPSEKQDGFCFWSRKLSRFFVGINISNISAVRVRFDAGHELGHALLHSEVTVEEYRDPAMNKLLEQQAHRFAGALLFPRKAFLDEVRVPSLDYFCSLKKRWGLSIAAMAYRAWNLQVIDSDERANLFHNMARRGWRGVMREPFDGPNEMAIERPRMLQRGIQAVVDGGVFGRAALLSTLSLPESEIEQLANLPSGHFRTADVVEFPVSTKASGPRLVDLESGHVVEFYPHKSK